MLYILLALIAAGTLLASEEGKVLLNYFLLGVGVIVVLKILFWAIVLLIGLYDSNFVQSNLVSDPFFQTIFWIIVGIYSLLGVFKTLDYFGLLDKTKPAQN